MLPATWEAASDPEGTFTLAAVVDPGAGIVCGGWGPRHQIGHNVEAAWHMDNFVRKFGYVRELPLLLSCPGVGHPRQSEGQRLVVGPDGEEAAFQVVTEMPDGPVDAEKLSIKSAVRQLSFLQFCREKTQRLPFL